MGVLVTPSTCILFWTRLARLSARLAEDVVYDLGVISLERSGFRQCVYKPPIAVYRKGGLWGSFNLRLISVTTSSKKIRNHLSRVRA